MVFPRALVAGELVIKVFRILIPVAIADGEYHGHRAQRGQLASLRVDHYRRESLL